MARNLVPGNSTESIERTKVGCIHVWLGVMLSNWQRLGWDWGQTENTPTEPHKTKPGSTYTHATPLGEIKLNLVKAGCSTLSLNFIGISGRLAIIVISIVNVAVVVAWHHAGISSSSHHDTATDAELRLLIDSGSCVFRTSFNYVIIAQLSDGALEGNW